MRNYILFTKKANLFKKILFFIFLSFHYLYSQTWQELTEKGVQAYQAGNYKEAISYLEKALKQVEKEFGKNNEDYATFCLILASLYKSQGRYAEAEPLYKEAKEIYAKVLGKEHPDYALSCNNLADLYDEQGRYAEAEPLYKEALAIRAKVLGKEHPDYALSCNNLAGLYKDQGRYAEAEPLYKEAKEIFGKVLGKEHPNYATSCNNLAVLYESQKRYAEAEPLYKEASQTLIANIRRNFIGLSEKEKEQYLATFKNDFELYFSFALKAQKPQLYGWLLENTMITKGLLFFSTTQLRRTLENSKDQQLQTQYQNWLEKRRAISKAYELTIAQRKEKNINLEALEKEANELEKQLSATLSAKGIQAELTPTPRSWKEIQQKLKENEALIEMVRVRYYDKKWTDSVLYVALIVKKNNINPDIVVLPHGNKIENEYIQFYRDAIIHFKTDNQSYKVFFSPFEPFLQNIKKIYFSGDGVYHQLNLETLFDSSSQKYLIEKLDIQLISTARDFLRFGKKELQQTTQNYHLYLMGFPDYGGKNLPANKAKNSERSFDPIASQIQRYFNASSIAPLPGTQKEVETISKIAEKSKWKVTLKLEEQASEEELKKVQGVRIVHIATHGFFLETKKTDSEKEKSYENPLMRSGLLLANCELSINGQSTGSKENGILTAKEAMELDLRGTDLVVLSACETGLGEIQSGEGVFGLQRAFQEAGAGSVIMSLWQVDDAATQELMSLFYENYLVKNQSKRLAFKNAQQALRLQYPEPIFWGAFVMVGE